MIRVLLVAAAVGCISERGTLQPRNVAGPPPPPPAEELQPAYPVRDALPPAAVFPAPAQPQPRVAGGLPVRFGVTLSRAAYSSGDRAPLRVKVDFSAGAAAAARQRPPLNLAIVLDRSGSMAQDRKLRFALEAARVVVENSSDRDFVAIVAYNDKATVLSPSGRAVNKAFLAHRLDEVTAEGWTDLSAGLLEGVAQVVATSAEGQSRHVLLLTDGLANRGVTDGEELRRIAASARARGIGVSTFGAGTDFDGKLLEALADAGGGRYRFVRAAEEIPGAFVEELQGLLAVVAENAKVELEVSPGARIARVLGGAPLRAPAAAYSLPLGALRAGERGGLLAELLPPDDGWPLEVTARLTYDDVAAGKRAVLEGRGRASFAARPQPDREDVALYGEVLDAVQTASLAAEGLDAEAAARARAAYQKLYGRAHDFALRTRDQELVNQTFLLKHFMQELDAAEAEGLTHDHDEARRGFANEADYERYLLRHHR